METGQTRVPVQAGPDKDFATLRGVKTQQLYSMLVKTVEIGRGDGTENARDYKDESRSFGGRRGEYKSAEGDLPMCLQLRLKVIATEFKAARRLKVFIWQKNVRGMKGEERLLELRAELEGLSWDFLSLNETWRCDEREYFTLEGGHVFCGSRGEDGAKGVAVLINAKWASRIDAFTRVDERTAYLDIRVLGRKMRIVTAYFPHSGYADGARAEYVHHSGRDQT